MNLASFTSGLSRRTAGGPPPARMARAALGFVLAASVLSLVLLPAPAAQAAGVELGAFRASIPAPAAPSNLHVCGSAVTWPPELCPIGRVTLVWNDNSYTETRVEFEWTIAQVGVPPWAASWTRMTLPANTRAYRPPIVVSGVLYLFRVRACNAGGCSPYSNMARYTSP
jgi:hypothetical protein